MVNAVIGQLRDVYKKREIKASVGLYNSGASELSQLTPGGYVGGGDVQSTLAYYGWGSSLENQNIAYQTVTENRISAEELENIEVLVMPNVITISQEMCIRDRHWVNTGASPSTSASIDDTVAKTGISSFKLDNGSGNKSNSQLAIFPTPVSYTHLCWYCWVPFICL